MTEGGGRYGIIFGEVWFLLNYFSEILQVLYMHTKLKINWPHTVSGCHVSLLLNSLQFNYSFGLGKMDRELFLIFSD